MNFRTIFLLFPIIFNISFIKSAYARFCEMQTAERVYNICVNPCKIPNADPNKSKSCEKKCRQVYKLTLKKIKIKYDGVTPTKQELQAITKDDSDGF